MFESLSVIDEQLIRIVDGDLSLNEKGGSCDCVFLQDHKRSIYDVRPLQCRTFPWWVSNLSSLEAWQQAATLCEGICDKGERLTRDEIEKHANRTT